MNKKQAQNPAGDTARPATDFPWDHARFRNWVAVVRTHDLCARAMTNGLAPLGLRLAHYDILANVFRFAGLTQQELANRLLVGRSNLSMLLPELEKRGLLAREADGRDRRIRRLRLTAAGEALTLQAIDVQRAILKRMFKVLDPAECDAIGEMMRRLSKALAEEA